MARFHGGRITSHAGGLLLREVDQCIGLLSRLSECFLDGAIQGGSGTVCGNDGAASQEDRYKKVHYDAEAIDTVLVDVFLERIGSRSRS